MLLKRYKKIVKTLSALALVVPFGVFAAPADVGTGEIKNPIGDATFNSILTNLLNILVALGAIVLAIMIVYTGFLFVRSGGNEERLKEAKNSLTYVIIGGAIILGALGIQEVIKDTVDIITS
ncbi:MAG: TrbC/VirB2 family protein [Candidatus Pacebacteria bacterium]|nr:TrbC/VirB2 family protein [Candidatus Paceibacterota bacterium]